MDSGERRAQTSVQLKCVWARNVFDTGTKLLACAPPSSYHLCYGANSSGPKKLRWPYRHGGPVRAYISS